MSETFRFFFIQLTFVSVVLVLHTYLGMHIIRRNLIFSDLVLDQLAAFGALVGIAYGVQYGTAGSYVYSFAAVVLGALLLACVNPKNPLIPREAVIGTMYALALVISLLMGDKLSGGSAYVTKTLTGSMLWVKWPIVIVTLLVYIALLIFHYKYRRKFIALTENSSKIKKQKLWDFLFFTTQGIITVLVVPIAGVLLAYAFLMVPAAIGAIFSRSWLRGLVIGWTAGFLACVIGLTASFHFNYPYGPSLILSMGILFLVSVIFRAINPLSKKGAAS